MAARLALFDVLEGRFGGGAPVESVPSDEHLLHSIVGNLERLFNTRQGSLPHLPDYGLPDLATIQRESAAALADEGREQNDGCQECNSSHGLLLRERIGSKD